MDLIQSRNYTKLFDINKRPKYEPTVSSTSIYSLEQQRFIQWSGSYGHYSYDYTSDESYDFTSEESSSSMDDRMFDILSGLKEKQKLNILSAAVREFGTDKFLFCLLEKSISQIDLMHMSSVLSRIVLKDIFPAKERYEHDIFQLIKEEQHVLNVSETDFPLYHWSERFSSNIDNSAKVFALEKGYKETVEKISKIIILEKPIPNYMKSIQLAKVGGKAGGQKYIIHGILFKFAVDTKLKGRWLYGGRERNDHIAAKALNNEIQAARALYPVIKGNKILRMPLMSTYSYLGVTILAVSLLPINDQTLVYGTADAGKTIYDGNEDISLLNEIENLARIFNFAPHPVSDFENNIHMLSLAADVEVHKSGDHYYILDLGRFFPTNDIYDPFVRIFRPGTLAMFRDANSPALSCDSFTGFGRVDTEKYEKVHMDYIDWIYERCFEHFKVSIKENISKRYISDLLHESGIDLRYMGKLRHQLLKESNGEIHLKLSIILLREMILRSIKTIFSMSLYDMMNQQVIPMENLYKEKIISLYSKFQVESDYWKRSKLKQMIRTKYGFDALTDEELSSDYHLLDSFPDDWREDIYLSIPEYARFKGGILSFKTEILGHTKSFIVEEENLNVKVQEVVNSENTTEEDLWLVKTFFLSDSDPELLYQYLIKYIAVSENENHLRKLLYNILKSPGPMFYERQLGKKMERVLNSFWKKNRKIIYISLMTAHKVRRVKFKRRKVIDDVFEYKSAREWMKYLKKVRVRDIQDTIDLRYLYSMFSEYFTDLVLEVNSIDLVIALEDISDIFAELNPETEELKEQIRGVVVKNNTYMNMKSVKVPYGYTFPENFRYRTLVSLKAHGANIDPFILPHTIQHLNIPYSKISTRDIGVIVKNLRKTLQKLDVSGTTIMDRALEYLKKCQNLQILELVHTDISDAGINYVAQIDSLTCLDISHTLVNGSSLVSLSLHHSLNELRLEGIPLETEHFCYLALFDSLRTLYLTNDEDTELDKGVKYLSQLNFLDVYLNNELLGSLSLSKNDEKKITSKIASANSLRRSTDLFSRRRTKTIPGLSLNVFNPVKDIVTVQALLIGDSQHIETFNSFFLQGTDKYRITVDAQHTDIRLMEKHTLPETDLHKIEQLINTNVFIYCFDMDSKDSLAILRDDLYPETIEYCSNTGKLVIGFTSSPNRTVVDEDDISSLTDIIQPFSFQEVLTNNVSTLHIAIEQAIRAAFYQTDMLVKLSGSGRKRKSRKKAVKKANNYNLKPTLISTN
eukprot:TRINITY_DN6731_c0_g1_i1.p1 TRINITY_DN6731_c0_g1~~TRINITY_DN6731_c0_g1_i1.p1  ORF type:complete len:1258 (-),score=238.36 TRINITY_DN6731_c0_g1_i1:47-3820(-)